MDLKEDFKGLLKKGYSVINDLNKFDIILKQIVLKQNAINSQNKAKELIRNLHQVVDDFDDLLQTFLLRTIDEKKNILDGHSKEVTNYVDYISNLCFMAENMIKEDNLQVVRSFGPEVKAEFLKSLKECRELKQVDYETFTSLDLEIDLSGLFQNTLVKIVSWNPECLEKQVVHSIGFGNVKKDLVSVNQTKINEKFPLFDDLEYNDSANNVVRSENIYFGASKNLSCPERRRQRHHSHGIKTLYDNKNNLLNNDREKVSLPDTPWMPQFDTAEPHYNVFNTFSSSCKTNSPTANLESSAEHKQNGKSNLYLSSNEESHITTIKAILDVPSVKTNMEASPTIAQVLKNLKIEVTEDEGVNNESTFKQFMPLFERSVNATNNPNNIQPRNLKCIKREAEDSDTDNFTTIENDGCATIPSSDMYKTGNKDMSLLKSNSWNLSNIMPLDMTFDLRTVLSANKSRIPEIVGHLVKTITRGGNTPFNYPIGVTVTADDHVVIADTFNHLVKVISNNKLVMTIGDDDGVKFCRPSAVVTDTEGNIYVKDDICIQIFNSRGELLQTVGKSCFYHPYGLALTLIEGEPVLIVIDLCRGQYIVYHYYMRRNHLQSYRFGPLSDFGVQFKKLRFLAVYSNYMLVSDLGASTMFLTYLDGKHVKTFGGYGDYIGGFKEPSGITVDAVGNWIVGDSKNNRLQVFTNDGQVLATIKLLSPIRRPSGIHLTSDGHLYVINFIDGVINVYNLC